MSFHLSELESGTRSVSDRVESEEQFELEQRRSSIEINNVLTEIRTLMGKAHAYAKNSGLVEGPCIFPKLETPRTPQPNRRSLGHPRQFSRPDASLGQFEFFQTLPLKSQTAPTTPNKRFGSVYNFMDKSDIGDR
jgi:hypothetical protein